MRASSGDSNPTSVALAPPPPTSAPDPAPTPPPRSRNELGELGELGEFAPVSWSPLSRRRFLTRGVVGVGVVMTGGVIASGFAAFARSRASVARIRTKPTSFPWFMEVERPRRFRKFVVMRYPHAALSAAEDVYPERILATMRQGFVVLSRLCPHDYANVRWLSRSDWFFCPGCGAQYNAVGESRVGPTPRGLDHLASLVVNGQLDIDPDDILPGAPIGTDTTGQKITGPIFPD